MAKPLDPEASLSNATTHVRAPPPASRPSRPSAAPVAEGDIIADKYEIERFLGRGGMGVVVAAKHLQLRQRVAIKFLLEGASPEAAARFLREARADRARRSRRRPQPCGPGRSAARAESAPL